MLEESQPLYKLIEDGLEYYHDSVEWKYKDNDLETRVRRFNEVNNLVKELSNTKLNWINEKAVTNHNKKAKGEYENSKWSS
jgi:hypothetical protein